LQDRFAFHTTTKFIFGKGVSLELAEELAARGFRKALVVTDPGIVKAGLLRGLLDSFVKNGVLYEVFSEVPPNPPSTIVRRGVQAFRDGGCDTLVAVGGGSVMDACKCIGIMTANEGDVIDYDIGIGTRTFRRPGPAAYMVPTTSGTGSEVNHWGVITNEATHWKSSIGGPLMMPAGAYVDPALTLGLPPSITAATGMDALTHAIEAYTTKAALNGASPVTDLYSLEAIRLIGGHLRQAYAQGGNYEARRCMMLGSTMASLAFSSVGLGNTHGLAHPLGGHFDIPHGVANAMLLPHVMRFNVVACPERFADIAVALGENIEGLSVVEAADKAVASVVRLAKDVGIPRLRSFPATPADFERLAQDALRDVNTSNNPRASTLRDLIALYEQAYDAE